MPGVGQYNVEYTLILRDQMTKVLNSAQARMKGFNSYVEAGGNQLASMFSKANVAMGAVAAGAWLVGKAIKEAMDFEQASVQMEVLLGSADKAAAMMKDIEQFAMSTPFESKDLLESTKLLLNFGVAQKKIMPLMQQLGDITAGDAQKLHSMSLAFGQMSSTGRLMGQDLNQMINAGFNPLEYIAKRTGKTVAELKVEMERGKISVAMVEQAFADATSEGGRFNGMMEKQSKTMGGQWSTAMDQFNVTLRDTGGILLPKLTGMLTSFNSAMSGKNIGSSYLTWMKNAFQLTNPIGWAWLGVERAVNKSDKALSKVKNTYASLDDQLFMVARGSMDQFKRGLEVNNQLIETAASFTEDKLVAALDRAQKMYGITSAQIDVFMGKVREQKKLLGEKTKGKTMEEMNLEELKNLQDGYEKAQNLATDRKGFLKDQKEIDKIQKRMDAITGKRTSGGGGSSGGSDGTTISSRAPQYYTITIEQLVGSINTKKETFNESDSETTKQVTQALVGALNDVQLIAANK